MKNSLFKKQDIFELVLYIKENVVNHIKECISTLKIKETDSLEKE